MTELFTIENLISFVTLCGLELVLGIDNVIFISIIASKLPVNQQEKARKLGLMLAVVTRIILLLSISWIIGLTKPFLTIFSFELSGRNLILLLGGLFLIAKSTKEIHHKFSNEHHEENQGKKKAQFAMIILQILLLDIVFSFDSVITAVGMVNNILIMIGAVCVSTAVMVLSAKSISEFVESHPTLKMLALSFLILVGFTLIAESFNQHISKGYIYFAMGFSLLVEFLNLRLKSKSH